MSNFRLALAQLDPTVGDLAGNAQLIKSAAQRAQEQDCDLLALPEMMLTGYPIEDLSLRPSFRDAVLVALEKLATDLANEGISDLPVIVGYLDHSHNAAAVLHQGKVVTKYFKHHLPNYGVFDEYEVLDEGEKPFPDEKVKAKQVALRDKGSAGLDRRMKMGLARRRAKEAGKSGGSQQDAGKDWYHGK